MSNDINFSQMDDLKNEEGFDRRLRIKCIERTMDEESKRTVRAAVASATLFVATFVTVKVSGLDVQEAIATEIKALSSWESLKEYFSMFTPATIASITASVISFRSFLTHRRRRNEALQQYDDISAINAENISNVIEIDRIETENELEQMERKNKTR